MEIFNAYSSKMNHVHTVGWESRNITTQLGKNYNKKSKVIASVVNTWRKLIILEINITKYIISFPPRIYIFNQANNDDDCLDVGIPRFFASKQLEKFRQGIVFKNWKASYFLASDLLSNFWKVIAGKMMNARKSLTNFR